MADEISWVHQATGVILYGVIRTTTPELWNTSGTPNFETLVVANWANEEYGILLPETPASSYFYAGDFPAISGNMVAGFYHVDVYVRAGATQAVSDTLLGTLIGYWDGTTFDPWASDVRMVSKDAAAADNLEADYDGTGYAGGTIHKQADLVAIHGTALTETAGQLAGRFVDFFDQASAGYSVATTLASFKATGFSTHAAADVWTAYGNEVIYSDMRYILGHLLTQTGTQLADAFQSFFDVATPTGTVNSLPAAAPDAAGGLPTGDASGRVDVGLWLGTAASTPTTPGIPKVESEDRKIY